MSTPEEQRHRFSDRDTRFRKAYERTGHAISVSQGLHSRMRDGAKPNKEIDRVTETPILDHLTVLPNKENFGLRTTEEFFTSVRNDLIHGKKIDIAVIGPSGAGKSSVITELSLRFPQSEDLAIIASEAVYDVAKRQGAFAEGREHGKYTNKEYDIGSNMIVRVAAMAFEEGKDLIFIDTPSTTGAPVVFPDGSIRRFGKNRGTSAIAALSRQSAKDENYATYVVAVVPGTRKIQQTFSIRRLLSRNIQRQDLSELLQSEPDEIDAPQQGASTSGLLRINEEIDVMLLDLYINGFISLDRKIQLPPELGYFPQELSRLTQIRKDLLGKAFYPYLIKNYFGIPSQNALIVENEALSFPRGLKRKERKGRYRTLNYVSYLTDEQQSLLVA